LLKEVIAELAPKVDKAIDEFLKRHVEEAEKLSVFHREYYANLHEFLLRGGKRLRPVAFIAAYEGVGGRDLEAAVEASICVELLHNSSLIHDDIIDRDELRRGGKTIHAKYRDWLKQLKAHGDAEHFGVSMGILAGDSLFNLGFKALAEAKFRGDLKLRALKLYLEAYEQLIDGVVLDTYLPLAGEVGEEQYLTMVKLKTGALFEKSLTIGATLADASTGQLNALSHYALLAAQGFQIQDDIIGLYGTEEEIGKPVGSDIREGKMTLLVIKALEQAPRKDRDKLKELLGKQALTINEVDEARKIIEDSGALSYAKELASKLVDEAKQWLRRADPPLTNRAVSFFEELADFFIQRSY